MGIYYLLPFLQKLKRVCGPARLLLFLLDKFVVRRQLKRFRKNRNCSIVRESIHLAAVKLTADGFENNIKFASYLTGNRPLTCKGITKRQRPSNTRTIFHVIHLKAETRDSRKEKPYASSDQIRHAQRLIKTYRVSNKIMLKE